MRIAVAIATIAALSAQPLAAATWTFKIGANVTGTTFGYREYCDNGPVEECLEPLDGPFSGHLSTIIALPSFDGVATFDYGSAYDGIIHVGDLSFDVWDVRGTLGLSADGSIIGSMLNFYGMWSVGDWGAGCSRAYPCTTWNTRASAQSFQATFLRSDDGPGPLPEPSTWAMMLIGLFGLGALLRRGRITEPRALYRGA